MPLRVEADLSEQQWLFMAERLQTGKVSAHLRLALEVNIIGDHVEEWQREMLGRRMADVCR